MNAFVSIVKNIITLIDNNKGFTAALILVAILLTIFSSFGTAVAAMFCLCGIRLFVALWRKPNDDVPGIFKIMCIGAAVFLAGPLVAMVQSFIAETSVWYGYLGTVARWIGYIGGSFVALFIILGVINWIVIPGWIKLVRWARK